MLPHPAARSSSRFPRFLANASLLAVSVILALGASELVLRTLVPPVRQYAALPPDANWTLIPAPEEFHGVEGVSHVRVNRFGVRGRIFGDDRAEYRILAVGGSTTFCRALDDTEVWTHLLEVDLNRTFDGRRVWVGNVGRDGATTRDHVLHLKYLLPQYPRIDVVVALLGVNDMISALQQGWQYQSPTPVSQPVAEREQMQRAFALVPGRLQDPMTFGTGPMPWYKTTALWHLGRRAKLALRRQRTIVLGGAGGSPLTVARRARTAAKKIDSLPSLVVPLIEYRRNLNAMVDLAVAAGVRLVFVTQPSAWRQGMSPAEEHQLWLGIVATDGAPDHAYFTTRVLARAMSRFNEALLDVCRARGLDCLDAANVIPHDTTAMYDDVHLNEQGSRLLARALSTYFRQRSPFVRPS